MLEKNNSFPLDKQSNYYDSLSIHRIFEEQAKKTPQAIALACDGQILSYQELNRRSNQLAHYLHKRGVQADRPIAFWVERSIEAIIGFLGILKAGAAYLPIDPCYPEERQLEMLENATSKVVLVGSNIEVPPSILQPLWLDDKVFEQESIENLTQTVTPEHLAYVMYTSGSTGKPKAIGIPHRGVVRLVKQTNYVKLNSEDKILQLSTLTFDASTFEIWGSLLNGGQLIIMPPETPTLEELSQAMIIHQISTLFLTPALFHLVVEEQLDALESLKYLLVGGDVMSMKCVEKFLSQTNNCQMLNAYGPTENTTFTTFYPVDRGVYSFIPIGIPISGTSVFILDSNLNPVSGDGIGEIYTGGRGLARGYLNNPELTAEKFIPNPFSERPGDRLYRTGDQGRFLPDGQIEFLGRIDNQVKLRGFRIELGEIESLLNQHPLVRNSLVVVQEISEGDRRLIAYAVRHNSYQESKGEIENQKHREYLVNWEGIYDDLYRKAAATDDPTFNIIGWNSSYTGEAIPAVEMAEWLRSTVKQILSLGCDKVLEIGCGTGMLLFKIAPHSSRYVGTDLSQSALDYVTQHLKLVGDRAEVSLLHRKADNFTGFEENSFNLVVLNSVTQHFPTMDYLLDVMAKAVQVVAPGGYIFLGDVRCQPLLSAFHSSVQLYQSPDTLSVAEWRERVEKKVAIEDQLVIDPKFFVDLKSYLPKISHVEVLLKRDNSVQYSDCGYNELTKFRYDVILYIAQEKTPVESEWLSWQADRLSLDKIQGLLIRKPHQVLKIKDIPNARVIKDLKIAELLNKKTQCNRVKEIRELAANLAAQERAVDPEDLYLLGEENSYTVHLSWSGSDRPGSYDIAFIPTTDRPQKWIGFPFSLTKQPIKPAKTYANSPYRPDLSTSLGAELMGYLEEKLPEYMIPPWLMVIPSFPLTNNGKIDRQKLPLPQELISEANRNYTPTQNQTEQILAELFSQNLKIDKVGRNESFFELGGNSLLAMQIISRIRDRFQVEIKIRQFFEHATVFGLAEIIDGTQKKNKELQVTGGQYEEGEL